VSTVIFKNILVFLKFHFFVIDQTAVAVDYDCLEQNVYWTDVSGRIINKVKADGSKYDVILQGCFQFLNN
jgi:hypothetical protein